MRTKENHPASHQRRWGEAEQPQEALVTEQQVSPLCPPGYKEDDELHLWRGHHIFLRLCSCPLAHNEHNVSQPIETQLRQAPQHLKLKQH